jgi:hypothetical protein
VSGAKKRERSAEALNRRRPVEIMEGDEVKSDLDSEDFVVTKIANSMVVLKSRIGDSQIMTGIDSLKTFYKKKEVKL